MDSADNAAMDSPRVINPEALLERLAAGELLKNIAADFDMPKSTLRDMLRRLPSYKAAISSQAESLVEGTLDDVLKLEESADNPRIARARVRYQAALDWAKARDAAAWDNRQMLVTTNPAPQIEGMGQLELARRVAWILTSGAAAARAQQALLSAPQAEAVPEAGTESSPETRMDSQSTDTDE